MNVGDSLPIGHFLATHPRWAKKVRWQVFTIKGTACVSPDCTFVATHARMTSDKGGGVHIDAYGGPGLQTMLTLDHHVPKSLGGKKTVDNLDPMCSTCNGLKRDRLPEDVMEVLVECLTSLLRYV